MRRILVAMLLAACGGSDGASNDVGNFVGTWNGTTTITAGGQTSSGSGFTHVTSLGGSEIRIADVCADSSGPSATVNGPASATVHSITCPPTAVGSCSSVVLTVTGGTGSINSGTLTLSGNGTLVGCGQTFGYTLSFVGHR